MKIYDQVARKHVLFKATAKDFTNNMAIIKLVYLDDSSNPLTTFLFVYNDAKKFAAATKGMAANALLSADAAGIVQMDLTAIANVHAAARVNDPCDPFPCVRGEYCTSDNGMAYCHTSNSSASTTNLAAEKAVATSTHNAAGNEGPLAESAPCNYDWQCRSFRCVQ